MLNENLAKHFMLRFKISSTVAFIFSLVIQENLEFNPLSPNIHIQILQTDLYTFPLTIS